MREPVRVVHVVDHLGYAGVIHGASRMYLTTLPRFDRRRFDVSLCVLRPRDGLTPLFEARGIRVRHLGRGRLDPRTLVDLLRLLRAERADLVHAHGYGSANFARVAARILGVPALVHAHDVDLNYPWYQRLADRALRPWTPAALAVSEAVKTACVGTRGIPAARVRVLPNAIPLADFTRRAAAPAAKAALGLSPGTPVVGTVARLRAEKGLEYLLDAMPEVLASTPAVRLLLVGDGPSRPGLEARARRLGVAGAIVFAGYQADVRPFLSAFDVKVLPATAEPFGLALLEAQAMGLAVVATDAGGVRDLVAHGETGLLVPPRDARALAAAIVRLLSCDDERARLAEAGRRASRRYDVDAYVRRLEGIYAGMTAEAWPRRRRAS